MIPIHYLIRSLLLVFTCTVLSGVATLSAKTGETTDREALVAGMEARLPDLMELKLKGAVGESNQGLVEARAVLEPEARRMLTHENRDRMKHYKLIAEDLKIPVAAVQRKRAEQIRANSPKGIWIESKTGVWYRE